MMQRKLFKNCCNELFVKKELDVQCAKFFFTYVLGELADKYNVTKTAIAIAWILRHPAKMQVITGTMNPVHLKEMAEADKINLTHEEWYKLYLSSGKFLP